MKPKLRVDAYYDIQCAIEAALNKIANENQIKKSKNSKTYQKPNLILNLLDGLVGKYFINLKIYATVRTNVRFLHRVRVKYPYLNVG
jgi:hypothetical protein